jgi:hypothetical protein
VFIPLAGIVLPRSLRLSTFDSAAAVATDTCDAQRSAKQILVDGALALRINLATLVLAPNQRLFTTGLLSRSLGAEAAATAAADDGEDASTKREVNEWL